jgi:hypothetical protein
VHKSSRVNQANVSITATRWCNRRCTHCYIDPKELANPSEMNETVFRSVFDRMRELVSLDAGLQEVEWEIIGGEITKMPVEYWRRNLPYALEQCRSFNADLKTPGSVNVLSNLIFADDTRRADYVDLFNQYADWPEMAVYTSWEPETNRFGKRDALIGPWMETVRAIKTKQKILDVILTKSSVALGPEYLLERFLPLGITDFSIKMISPYGSGKKFWQPNMIEFAQMSDYLCRLFDLAPKGITFTPADEMSSAMFRGTSYQCIGNFRYDLAVEPDGLTTFNASQTTEEAALGDGPLFVDDPQWAYRVLADNTAELDQKLSKYHDYCFQCEFHSFCAGGWYHYRIADPADVRAWDQGDCPGYKRLWTKVRDRIGAFDHAASRQHASMSRMVELLRAGKAPVIQEHGAGRFYEWLKIVDGSVVEISTPVLWGKTLIERLWAYESVRAQPVVSEAAFDQLDASQRRVLVEHVVYADLGEQTLSPGIVWGWARSAEVDPLASLLLAVGERGGAPAELIAASHNVDLLRWVFANPAPGCAAVEPHTLGVAAVEIAEQVAKEATFRERVIMPRLGA